MGGQHAIARGVINTYSCNIVNNANSWWKTSDSLNLEVFNEDFEQVQPLCWKRLAQLLYMYQVLHFHVTMGCSTVPVPVPMALREFDDWSWRVYPKMLSWFIYLWSLHKYIIGPCHDKCSAAVIIDGHQKCRRSPSLRSHYCSLHQDDLFFKSDFKSN